MSDTQMKRLLEGIKDNESKTQALSQSLMQFNESFKSLVEHLTKEEPMASLEENDKAVKGLNKTLESISEEIQKSRLNQEERFNSLESQMKSQSAAEGVNSQGAETALYHKGKIYMISQDRVCVSKYDTVTGEYEMVYGEEREIKAIFLYQDEILLHHMDGKLSTLEGKDLGAEDIVKAAVSAWGLLMLNKQKQLMLYKNSKYRITLAAEVEHFDLMAGRYLFYQTATKQGSDLMIYKDHLKDLMNSPIEASNSEQLFAYGVDPVHDKVYTIEADGSMKEQAE